MAEAKKRVFHIAKELNISHTEIMAFLEREGEAVGSHMSPVEPDIYEKILGEFAKERVLVERRQKEKNRIDIETARRTERASKTARFDRILTLDEQRDLENVEAEKQKIEAAAKILQQEVAAEEKRKEEEFKQLAREELTRQSEEPVAAAGTTAKEQKRAARGETGITAKTARKKGAKEAPAEQEPKAKLTRINLIDIESKIEQGRKRPAQKSKDKSPRQPKSVEQTLRQTLASISTKERKHRPARRDRVEAEDTAGVNEARSVVHVHEFMSINELASAMDVQPMEVISVCMQLGIMATINQRLDMDTITLVAEEFDFDITEDAVLNDETILEELSAGAEESPAVRRPPIVTVMGHVDHGKTSFLDSVRSANVVEGESGGITQHIGAYAVTLDNGQRITFLDTPGHAAFTSMRARGAQVTDIVVLIVAADDAVMPQTIEAIDHAKAANVSIVVAINKIDKPEADAEKVKRELSELGLLVEDWGGKIQSAEISAKTGVGIDDLMDKILLEADLLDLKAVPDGHANGTVIEARLDRGLGAVATVLVQKGTLRQGDTFLCGTELGKVRAMMNEHGVRVKEANPSDPVQILGFDSVPPAGDRFIVFKDDREAKRISDERTRIKRERVYRRKSVQTLDEISKQIQEGAVKHLSILVKGDVDGSVEAITDSFSQMGTSEVAVNIIHRGVGMVSESDILLAKTSGSIIIAFRVATSAGGKELARNESVEIRDYDVIYDAVNEVKLALEGLLEPEKVESALGVAVVRDTFKVPKLGVIAGVYINEGVAVRNAYLRVKRDDEIIHEGLLTSLRRFKDDVKEVQSGFECGIGVEGFTDFENGDLIEIYEVKEIKRTLA
ncbi:MAG: translation initiation factor IF-2 [Candidatus Marinimicrobia bacterium]|nr:translation initiation factor IF-2 [Candidatus Neomarinimicrobiota bacterium]